MVKFFIDQHGCAKNQVDGEEMAARLESAGYSYSDSPQDAEVIIVNTCGFIESAKQESISAVIDAKTHWPGKKVIVAGCLSQRYYEALMQDLAEADGIFGNSDLSKVSEIVERVVSGERSLIAGPQPRTIGEKTFRRTRLFDFPGTAHVKITEGCSNHCSYCAIPLIRGELRSHSMADILEECADLGSRGIHEINLIGQDLASYGKDLPGNSASLPALLREIARLPYTFRIRVLYIHPDHFPFELLEIMRENPRILPYFDIPFQHASERLLTSMNRKGSAERYLQLVEQIRTSLPDVMIRSTLMTGFPGETEQDFAILRDFQDAARLDWLGVFAYSREEDTPAYSYKNRIPKKLAESRKKQIEERQQVITEEQLARFIGQTVEVIIEEQVENEALSLGRAWMQAPDVDGLTVVHGKHEPGSLVKARIEAIHGVDLEAAPLSPEQS